MIVSGRSVILIVHFTTTKKYDIITVGNIDENKNQELLLDSIIYLKQNINFNEEIKLIVVGDGQLRNLLMEKSENNGLSAYFSGNIRHDLIWNYLSSSKIYVHTSKNEGFPTSIMEAFLMNLPVIVVDAPYVEEIRKRGFHLTTVKNRTPEELAYNIKTLLEKEDTVSIEKNKEMVYKLFIDEKNTLLDLVRLL